MDNSPYRYFAMLCGILKYDTLKTLPNSSDLEQVRASFICLCSG